MRRSMVLMAVVALALGGCATPPPAEPDPVPADLLASASLTAAPAPAPGDCLDDDGSADWAAVTTCTRNHGVDVVAVEEWPGMAGLVDTAGAEAVFRGLTEGAAYSRQYDEWASAACLASIRDAVGWSGVEFDERFAEYAVLPAAPFVAESSIADRSTFVGGEHRTVCTVRWWEALRYPEGLTFVDLHTAEFPRLARNCWNEGEDGSLYFVACGGWHDAQSIVAFDIAAAYGVEALRTATVQNSLDTAAADCGTLVGAALPAAAEEIYDVWSISLDDEAWAGLSDGDAEAGVRYAVECVVSRADGAPVRGDLFLGDVEVRAE